MNISKAAAFADISVKTARYYCDIGLIFCQRSESGYRVFMPKDATNLRFIARARADLMKIAAQCPEDENPNCPILNMLASKH